MFIVQCSMFNALAQIKVGGNVYGGGNMGNVDGSTKVTVKKGDLNKVFGGARMANVGGNAYVNIDGAHATGYTVINYVFGGNDIAGTIGTAEAVGETLPAELEDNADGVDNTWNTYVHLSSKMSDPETLASDNQKTYIGQLYAGGNGDYFYDSSTADGETTHYIYTKNPNEGGTLLETIVTPEGETGFHQPNVAKTYLDMQGGSIVYAYGGGNKATVTEKTIIHVDNPSDVVNHIFVDENGVEAASSVYDDYEASEPKALADGYTDLLTNTRFKEDMGINLSFSRPSSGEFQVGRLFGGNNLEEMAIRPTWNLQSGKIRNLYSGGNKGAMTSPEGLLLEIPATSTIVVDNLFGGCRMADVRPSVDGIYTPTVNLPGYYFPNQLSARVLVRGGDINNVYGGNDVTGQVYGGNAIGVYATIRGNLYGGGNGDYPYTDNEDLRNNSTFGDLYYSTSGYTTSYDALNAFRPNAEQVSIRVVGEETRPTIIKGSIFVGGNCASLATHKEHPMVELKIGSNVIADNVYLGNNGAGMIDENYLKLYAGYVDENDEYNATEGTKFSSLNLRGSSEFAEYMEGVAMNLMPAVVFDNTANGDPATYTPNSSYIGSFFCGGNVGSMAVEGKETFTFDEQLNIFTKLVGGCNNANIAATEWNAAYEGGVLGSKDERTSYTEDGKIKDRLEINLEKLTITPLRWNDDKSRLIWNTNKWDNETGDFVKVENSAVDKDTRLLDGNVYGGCYNSGHVNGNVVININEDLLIKDDVFGTGTGIYGRQKSGVDRLKQRDDLMALALAVFGGGYGADTEIWGSTTVNHNKGYAFQIFGGGEEGVVGRKVARTDDHGEVTEEYEFNPAYSSTVNLNGTTPIYSSDGTAEGLAETEYIYGGGNEGDVCGNTLVNLGNGRIFDAFGGASDADILGHTEVYIGRQPKGDGTYKAGFPWVSDIVYGGNDFGGKIWGEYETGYDFTKRLRNFSTDRVSLHGTPTAGAPGLLQSSSYVEYLEGRVDTIFGGGYGFYDYSNEVLYGAGGTMPVQESAFVNIRPVTHDHNLVNYVFGGGTGYPRNRAGDNAQNRSYVLIDIPDGVERFGAMEVFGAGAFNGLGMGFTKEETFDAGFNLDNASAVVDLLHGQIGNVYGGSYNEGNTRRTVVNVPAASTIQVGRIFGGAYGTQILPPCDVYETHVNYLNTSENARVSAIYGGNNNERRSLYTHVNISSPVWSNKEKGYMAKVYGAGRGIDTWSEYTEVNLLSGAKVYEAYGGGEMGHVLNAESIEKYMQLYRSTPSSQISHQDPFWSQAANWVGGTVGGTLKDDAELRARWTREWVDAWTLGDYYVPADDPDDSDEDGDLEPNYTGYVGNAATNLTNSRQVRTAELDKRDYTGYTDDDKARNYQKYNTNVIIHEGASVGNYAYGGGYGEVETHLSGDTYGNTYIALLGGSVTKDMYAAGSAGNVNDLFGVGAYNSSTNPTGFTATATAYVKGGTCRNVYGGGWKGDVGHHTGTIADDPSGDIPGETHVVIGDLAGTSFTNGIPAIQRNAYGGGEGEDEDGGAVYGTTHLTLNNGYIGYAYNAEGSDDPTTTDFDERYVEKIEDETRTMPNTWLTEAGCLFGGGYTDNSFVDKTQVIIYGGHVRNSAFGGGEVAPIGRGDMKEKAGGSDYELKGIYRPGKTLVEMFGGHVHQNVFGGGRGFDNLARVGSLHSPGYVFGQTEVHVHGGEIGTAEGVEDGDGNVFGGGDVGFVYSAYENPDGSFAQGMKDGVRYDGIHQGYYYKHNGEDFATVTVDRDKDGVPDVDSEGQTIKERIYTEDCKVLVEPNMKVITPVTINGHSYEPGDYVPIADLNTLKNKKLDAATWACLDSTGIIIHNAVFAGGNMPSGSMATNANTPSVFGNATASVEDIFHRDMITLGTRHTGGLYGDGNLTLVDGYRELNITNYGTDYYSIAQEISIADYHKLPKREADYYELRYTCLRPCKDKDDTRYHPESEEDGVTIKASTITADEMQAQFVIDIKDSEGNIIDRVSVKDNGVDILIKNGEGEWVPNPNDGNPYWKESGVLPVYAGRLMNSIQRADFCGVFGSRMVMQGAKDRVPEEADFTNYTINRVREVSLNKMESVIASDLTIPTTSNEYYKFRVHGNYFGIYNIVNYLGALTSDVDFGDVRKTDNTTDNTKYKSAITINGNTYDYESANATYYNWKQAHIKDKTRNNGSSHNKVALASGVYLELTTEESTGDGLYEKVWGPITGVIELDLINVSTGIGGGFVYAKNQHGTRAATKQPPLHQNTTLTALNSTAVTQWDYEYPTADGSKVEWETSGNFVHSTQTIIDDCYNISNKYLGSVNPDGSGAMPAHFWYIKGSTYVYDQYISAYTGSTNAYSETVDIPLTIAAASHGRMKLLDVKPNLYAYYSAPGVKLEEGKRIVIKDKSYYLNDPISYWDWYLLSRSEKDLFVDFTYTNCVTYQLDGELHEAGTVVMTPTDFTSFKSPSHEYLDADGDPIKKADTSAADDEYIFRSSNNVSHDTGYLLTYELNNPSQWDNWFTLKSGSYRDKKTLAEYAAMSASDKEKYYDGPTYRLNSTVDGDGILLGQHSYKEGQLITESVETTYQAAKTAHSSAIPDDQATFVPAYIVTKKITVTDPETGREIHYNEGVAVSSTFAADYSTSTEPAYLCTSSIQLTKENVIYKDSKVTESERTAYINDVKSKMGATYQDMTLDAIKDLPTTGAGAITTDQKSQLIQLATLRDELTNNIVPAYYCTAKGYYGGNYYEKDHNYRGLEAWSSLSEDDHKKFVFNYDALDLLIDPDYVNPEGEKYQYDGNYLTEEAVRNAETGNKAGYSVTTSVDYTASYNDSEHKLDVTSMTVNRNGTPTTTTTLEEGDELTREQYESLPNEQRHFSPIAVKSGTDTYYIVHTAFQVGSTPYAVGETISSETYSSLPTTEQGYVTQLKFTSAHEDQTIYYCRESYEGTAEVTAISSSEVTGGTAHTDGGKSVAQGTIISSGQYKVLPNKQKDFTIHGISPTETSTLYVSRESDIYDLSKDKIITVIYQYDYDETDGSGNVTPISERHVVNIHLTFKSGVPTVEDITAPEIILPGNFITMREPAVTPGAYEITGGGWELFESQRDAESHTNGIDYDPNFDALYWYQDGHYVAYYAKSYLGRTYSNAVPVSVANYHDLKRVMDDTDHHYYIDNANVKRDPKIYINDYSGSTPEQNGLDLFKNLYDLSVLDGSPVEGDPLYGHALLNSRVRAGENLEFFLRTDISVPSGSPAWTSIAPADGTTCFEGVLHGDGHTLSGLDHSLFGKLCGSVYNLGVTGSFNTAGVADTGDGYVESCWVKTTATTPLETKPYAVFGNPTASTGYQVVNSYFCDSNNDLYNTTTADGITTSGDTRGTATAMSARAFYNGTVAYDLNNFYLYKRYSDHTALGGSSVEYQYLLPDNPEVQTGHYASNPSLCSSGYEGKLMYVEDRYADGDFRYAGGTIPAGDDERYWIAVSEDPETHKDIETVRFSPLWPDDYIFFGQKLTYGYSPTYAHQNVPTAVVRDGGRLSLNPDANRVYRAPAYYRNSTMGVAHFNPAVFLAQKEKLTPEQIAASAVARTAYPGMTAIDFAGHNDIVDAGGTRKAYQLGSVSGGFPAGSPAFYPPLLDDDGLTAIMNCDETQNLLVYAPSTEVNDQTFTVLTSYFKDPDYSSYYDNSEGYRCVAEAEPADVHGHLVQSDLTATNDHLLVDKQDFNAPIAYTFDADHLMWYQRIPANSEYVDRTRGWQGISVPFTAELVTTHQKGEITHFYSGSASSANDPASKIGHEYWLRTFTDIAEEGTGTALDPFVAKATFLYPSVSDGFPVVNKTVTNDFLWDYYYENEKVHNQQDENYDTYLQYTQYYKDPRNYSNYPLLTKATPYIIGLPGKLYYEFDLSGSFVAQNTAENITKLPKQVITLASATGISIGVSDAEMTGVEKTEKGSKEYTVTFKPSYMNQTLANGSYVMNSTGDAYVKLDNSDIVTAFRPYFTASVSGAGSRRTPSRIIFGGPNDNDFEMGPESALNGKLEIYANGRSIIVRSHMTESTTVRIANVAGIIYRDFVIEPGQVIETPVKADGVYIVNKKKLFIK